MKAIGDWLKRSWGWLVAAALALAALVLGADFLLRRRRLGAVRDQVAADRARAEIAEVRGAREEVEREIGELDRETAEVYDAALKRAERRFAEAHEGGEDVASWTNEELDTALAEVFGG